MSEGSEIDQQFMRRAIRLAMNGRGRVEPNPMVGCVIVSRDGRVIGEGYHQEYGGPHAEPNALASCTESPAGATAYVTLEPCCHVNKKTPPCAPRVISAGIARVVVGCLDPNPEVDGKGVAMLREAGVRVDGPVLEGEAKQLIAPFIKSRRNRPYVTLKWAETADRKVAGANFERMQISNEASSRLVHLLRSRSDGILVGVNTVMTDDPMLTARGVATSRPLVRFVLDSGANTPTFSRIVRSVDETPVVIACRSDAYERLGAREREFRGVFFVTFPNGEQGSGIPLDEFMEEMFSSDVLEEVHPAPFTHLMVEPGPTLARSFFDAGLVDRLWVFRSPIRVDDVTAPAAAEIPAGFVESGRADIDGDTLTEYLNTRSGVYFANAPSADFVLARR
jgi:diaminohydroxyphosphoribosylaminopyrimidine deaminase/5-amino-6-(5-phosphoribosylamino)uracil reductase